MKKHTWIAGAAFAAVVLAIPVTYSVAQGPGQGGQFPPQGGQMPPHGAPFQPQMPPMHIMPGGGSATMLADGEFLYVLQGNRLFKVDKKDLAVKAVGGIPTPQPERANVPPPEEKTE